MGGIRVRLCNDSTHVPNLARALNPQAILMDVQMPGKSGLEIFSTLRQDPLLAKIPFIFITGQHAKLLNTAGALGIISKPFDPETLSNKIIHLWNLRHE